MASKEERRKEACDAYLRIQAPAFKALLKTLKEINEETE